MMANAYDDKTMAMRTEALRRLRLLKIHPTAIREFEKNGTINVSERMSEVFDGILFWANEDQMRKIREFEAKTGNLVYHGNLIHTLFGDMLSLLYVSKSESEWDNDRADLARGETVAMVLNGDITEAGYIGIKPMNGGVSRTW